MYRIIMNLQEYTHNLSGMLCLIAGYILATALFVFVVGPFHNYIQARVARSNGDEWVEEAGYLTMNPSKSFHWIGLLSVLVNRMGFTRRIRYRRRYFDAPVLGTLWLSLAGILVYLVCCVVFVFVCVLCGRLNSYGIANPTDIPTEALSFWGCVFHTLYSTVFYLSRMCIYSAMFNLIPIAPMDMGEVLFTFVSVHWADVIKKNDAIIAIGLFVLSFFILGMPNSFIVNASTEFIGVLSSAFNFILNIFI